jgi:NADH:ubiquinone oxidoreductase subunit 4 (chain M)
MYRNILADNWWLLHFDQLHMFTKNWLKGERERNNTYQTHVYRLSWSVISRKKRQKLELTGNTVAFISCRSTLVRIICMHQTDLNYLIAYTSVAHIGIVS